MNMHRTHDSFMECSLTPSDVETSVVLDGPSVPKVDIPGCVRDVWLPFRATLYTPECPSRSSRLDFSCSDNRSLVERARVGEAGVGGTPEALLVRGKWYGRVPCDIDWEGTCDVRLVGEGC